MEKEEALRIFIKKFSDRFRANPFPYQAFKDEKRQFFETYAKSNPPPNKEIAGTALSILIESRQIHTTDDLESLLVLPFFADNIHNRKRFREKFEAKQVKYARLVDPKALEEEAKRERLFDQLQKDAEEKALQEKAEELKQLDDEIEERKRDVHSILDSMDNPILPEPEKERKSPSRAEIEWWEDRGLSQDPFPPITVGIRQFPLDMYDQIVHTTPLFVRYLKWLETHPAKLLGNTLVYGLYGSGKSTFFEYLGSKMSMSKICCVYISISTAHDIESVNYDCTRQLYNKLLDEARGRGIVPPNLNPSDRTDSIERLIESLSLNGAKGFVVFVEDLHKGNNLDVAVQFLVDLQSLTRELTRKAHGSQVCFYVEASTQLNSRLTDNPQFSGSIERSESMPPLEEEWALDVVNRRLKAFSLNPANPVQVTRRFIEKVFFKIKQDRTPDFFTIREVLRQVGLAYERGEPEVTIPTHVLDDIRQQIESNPRIIRPIQRLASNPNLIPSQLNDCLRLLIDTYISGGYPESSLKRNGTAELMWYLEWAGLVYRSYHEGVRFFVTNPLLKLSQATNEKHGLTLDYYLPKLYGTEREPLTKPKSPELEFIDSILPQAGSPLSIHLTEARTAHARIIAEQDYKLATGKADEIIRDCSASLAHFTRAYEAFEGMDPSTDSDFQTVSFWREFWWSPEAIINFLQAFKLAEDEEKPEAFCRQIVAAYHDSFEALAQFMKNEYEGKKRLMIPLNGLTDEEIRLFHECRDLLKEALVWPRYDQVNTKVSRHIERKLRLFLLNVFKLAYGEREERLRHVEPKLREGVEKRLLDSIYGGSQPTNEFDQVNRGDYKRIMTGKTNSPEGRQNWIRVFATLFPGWTEDRLYSYLNVSFERQDKTASHTKPIGPENEGELYHFLRESIDFISRTNMAYLRFVSSDNYRFASSTSFFTLNPKNPDETVMPIVMDQRKAERCITRLLTKESFEIDLEDQTNVEGRLLLDYRSACALMAILSKQSPFGVTLQFLRRNPPVLRCALTGPAPPLATSSTPQL